MNNRFAAMELRHLSNLCMRYMENHAHKKDIDSITGTNTWIISFLHKRRNEDVFQRDLEKKFGITRSTASKVINLMVAKGLIVREPVPYDARLKKLILTPYACELAAVMQTDANSLEELLTSGISGAELSTFFDCIDKMKTNLNKNL